MSDKIINKIQKKIDAIEKLHDKESLMCEEVKDLLEELRENQVEEENLDDEDFEATNSGVWATTIETIKVPNNFTDWELYKKDKPI